MHSGASMHMRGGWSALHTGRLSRRTASRSVRSRPRWAGAPSSIVEDPRRPDRRVLLVLLPLTMRMSFGSHPDHHIPRIVNTDEQKQQYHAAYHVKGDGGLAWA